MIISETLPQVIAWCWMVLLTRLASAIAAQESLSGLETEMRKLEGIVKEIVDEMDYLKKREERFSSTNGMLQLNSYSFSPIV